MLKNPITVPLPADLPTDWTYDQTVAPTGEEAGMEERYGYNYLMAQVNAAQTAVRQLGEYLDQLELKASDLTGTLPLTKGGTGADSASAARKNLGLDKVDNTADKDKSVKRATTASSAESVNWSNVSGKPSTYPPSSHSHSWDSVTGKPSTFTPSSHTHSWDSVTSKPSTFTPTSHNHDERYYTESEMNTKLAGKSDTSHNHDSRYYTKAQVDDLMGGVRYPNGKLVFTGVGTMTENVLGEWSTVTVPSTVSYVKIADVDIIRGGTGHIEFDFRPYNISSTTTARGTATFSSSGTVSFNLRCDYTSATGGSVTVYGYQYV